MSTQLEEARAGRITEPMQTAASIEGVEPEWIRDRIADGKVVLPFNHNRRDEQSVRGVGQGLRTKVNANIGTSRDIQQLDGELEKLAAAQDAGADAVMDLSTGGDLRHIRRALLAACTVTTGSVPIYEAVADAYQSGTGLVHMKAADVLAAVRKHAEDGVDFLTVHCGVSRDVLRILDASPRVCGIVSRGGEFLAAWMRANKQENPLLERFDEVLDICREFDATLSLGDGLRPGAIADSFDPAQIAELNLMAELANRAHAAGVQVMMEGPGHVPLDQVTAQIKLQKSLSGGRPFYVLGPIVTDVAPGYDHITSAIGGAIAAAAGADFLCYVTPSEHLALPTADDVRRGVITARIAAHAADIAKGLPGAADWDRKMSVARRARDWDAMYSLCIDPARARAVRSAASPADDSVCTMCGEYCVFKVSDDTSEAKAK